MSHMKLSHSQAFKSDRVAYMLEGSVFRYIIQVGRPDLRAAGLLKWKQRTDSSRLTLWIMFPGEISNINNPRANNLVQKWNFCSCSAFRQDLRCTCLNLPRVCSWWRCTVTHSASAPSAPLRLKLPQRRPKYFITGNTKIFWSASVSHLIIDVHYYPFITFYTWWVGVMWMNSKWNPKGIANSFQMSKQKLKQ